MRLFAKKQSQQPADLGGGWCVDQSYPFCSCFWGEGVVILSELAVISNGGRGGGKGNNERGRKMGGVHFLATGHLFGTPPPSVFFEDSSKHVLKYSYLKVMDRYIIY